MSLVLSWASPRFFWS